MINIPDQEQSSQNESILVNSDPIGNKIDWKSLIIDLCEALGKINEHGCCIMHNDDGCPGCIASEALAKFREAVK